MAIDGWAVIWYSEVGLGGLRSRPVPLAVPNVTAHPSTASVPITVLLYDGPLLCGFNVAIKGLTDVDEIPKVLPARCCCIVTTKTLRKTVAAAVMKLSAYTGTGYRIMPSKCTRWQHLHWGVGRGLLCLHHLIFYRFCRAMLCISAAYAAVSVRLSVVLSVTFVYYVETYKHVFEFFFTVV